MYMDINKIIENNIDLLSIKDIIGLNRYYIPNYQRGYRWSEYLVETLLYDIDEFIEKRKDGIYCVQPLVVKARYINQTLETESNYISSLKEDINKCSDIESILQKLTEIQSPKWQWFR